VRIEAPRQRSGSRGWAINPGSRRVRKGRKNGLVPEGLSPTEVGKEIHEHAAHLTEDAEAALHHHDRLVSIAEAVLLAIVALTAAWADYSAAKWGTEASLKLAKASATRTKANRAFQLAATTWEKTWDGSRLSPFRQQKGPVSRPFVDGARRIRTADLLGAM
jgi:hypothetical protein